MSAQRTPGPSPEERDFIARMQRELDFSLEGVLARQKLEEPPPPIELEARCAAERLLAGEPAAAVIADLRLECRKHAFRSWLLLRVCALVAQGGAPFEDTRRFDA